LNRSLKILILKALIIKEIWYRFFILLIFSGLRIKNYYCQSWIFYLRKH